MREKIEFDILYVGAGPASLSSALHLSNLIESYNKKNPDKKREISIGIIDKAREAGNHTLSGAVMDTKALAELIPDFEKDQSFKKTKVAKDEIYFLTKNKKIKFPVVPPQFDNHGNYIISLSDFVRWLFKIIEKKGIDILWDTQGQELIWEGNKLIGVKAGEKGLDKNNEKKANYEPGADLCAKAIVFAEGVHGSLTKQLTEKLGLNLGKNPQNYALGVKELWEIDKKNHKEGLVIHTMGYPADIHTYGGGFIYHMAGNKVAVGYSVGLDCKDPSCDPQEMLQKFKLHPLVKNILANGKLVCYGAKCIPEGGLYSMPELSGNGFLIIGDCAGFLNSARLKGIHLSMKSGMLAAEALFDAFLKNDFSENSLETYEELIDLSWIKKELYGSRNVHQGFKYGLIGGMMNAGLGIISGGRGFGILNKMKSREDHKDIKRADKEAKKMKFDGNLTYDKLSEVFYSKTKHGEDQPCHIKISDFGVCNGKCREEFKNPCQHFCPGNVYEMIEDEKQKKTVLKLNPSNCLHCKTCDIKDPYQVITWEVPEEGGPEYREM